MLFIGQILILLGFIKMARSDDYSAIFCAGFYGGVTLVLRSLLVPQLGFISNLTVALISIVVSYIYFWGLKKTISYPIFHLIVLIGGLLIGLL